MKLQAQSSKALNAALQKSAKCINSKNAINILNYVLVAPSGKETFAFTSSTGDAQLTIPAPLTLVSGKHDTQLCLPVKDILSLLATLPDCTVTFDFAENDARTLTLEYCTTVGGKDETVKSGKVQLTYEDGMAFPFLNPVGEEATHIVLPMATFGKALDMASDFVMTDEFRPQMSCLNMDISEDRSELVLVGTDGHTLGKMTYSNDPKRGGGDFFRGGQPGPILLHQSNFRTLSAFDDCESVDIYSDGHIILIAADDIEFLCKCVEGRYPNYNSVIPKGNPFFACFNKKEMLGVLKRVSLFGDTTNGLVELRKSGLFFNVSARDADFGRAAEDQVVLSDMQCDESFAMGFNAQKLATCVSALPGDTVRMQMSEATRPVIFTADEPAPTVLTLCMPMQL